MINTVEAVNLLYELQPVRFWHGHLYGKKLVCFAIYYFYV